MSTHSFVKTGKLLKNYLKSSKSLTILLVILPFLLAYGTATSNMSLLSTPALLHSYIEQNQGNFLLGNIAANTIEGATIWRIRLATAIILSIFNIILVVSHTRKEEDDGKLEILYARPVGAKAPLTAVFIKILGANILGGFMMALGFSIAGFHVSGSIIAGIATMLCGCFFTVMTAVSAQIARNARIARGIALGLVAFFLFWGIVANAIQSETMLLFSPLFWVDYANPFANERLIVFPLALFIVLVLLFATYILNDKRDLGGGFIHERNGKPYASPHFKTPLALAWRLQRGMLIAWVIAYTVMGAVIAFLTPSIENMLSGTNFLPELSAIEGSTGKAILAILSYILSEILVAYVIMTVLRIRDEEASIHADILLSRPVSRIKFAASHILIGFLGSAVAISIFGALTGEFQTTILRIFAIWLIASITVFIYGFWPRLASPISWTVFGLLLVLEFLWEMGIVGKTSFHFSPFSWVYPGVTPSITSILVMIILSIALIRIGLHGFSNRDIVEQ
ncbi:ABC transporter permease [Listeria monocytogenes]|nr:hypothetical protein [Listeria monocytogenes]